MGRLNHTILYLCDSDQNGGIAKIQTEKVVAWQEFDRIVLPCLDICLFYISTEYSSK